MTDVIRTYQIGDSVLAAQALVAPPVEPHGVRLEIPEGTRGIVVEARQDTCSKPYAVVFHVTSEALVEIDVNGGQIARVNPPAVGGTSRLPVPRSVHLPVPVNPSRRPGARERHTPSKRYPHYYCRPLHASNVLLCAGAYALAVLAYPWWTLLCTALALLMAYALHLRRTNRWSVFPEILLRHDEPSDAEELVVCAHCVPRALVADVCFAVSVAVLLICYYAPVGEGPYALLVGVALICWAARAAFHENAARVVPKTD